MGIEEVGVGATTLVPLFPVRAFRASWGDGGEQYLVDMIGLFGVMQSGPEVDAPASAPAGGLVALDLQ